MRNINVNELQNQQSCQTSVSGCTVCLGDCLIVSDIIESGSVDLILTDLPYGNMNTDGGRKLGINGWDLVIEPKIVYEIANRILRKNGKMVLFSQEPYTTQLINEAIPNVPFSYRAIWEKDNFAVALGANKNMVSYFEDILVFSKTYETEAIHPLRPYFKIVMDFIGLNLKQINTKLGHRRAEHTFYIDSTQYGLCTEKTYKELIDVFGIDNMKGFKPFAELKQIDDKFKTEFASTFNLWEGNKYKSNILKYKKDYNGYHPTQKPVLLLEDLIKTFSNEGNLVVDLTMGSGSTGVACKNTNRRFIGIEQDENYYNISKERIHRYIKPKQEEFYFENVS
jgi:site-specific DNA-methyltransferase (adenine-specific)